MRRKQIIGIQVIRGISALFIILYHYTSRYNEVDYVTPHENWTFSLPWGCFAVSTFFLISGFLTATDLSKAPPPAVFLKKRINRLYPAFWVAMIITFVVSFFTHQGNVGFIDLLANISMIPAVLGFNHVDGVYWTLQYEIFFYVVISLFLLIKKRKLVITLIVFWLMSSVAFYFLQYNLNTYLAKIIRVFGVIDYVAVFVLGLSMGLFKKKYISKILYLTIIVISFISFYLYRGLSQSIFFAINFGLLQYVSYNENCLINRDNRITRSITWIAALSYPLYLIHQKIGYILISNTIIITGYEGIVIIIIPFIVSITIAYYLHKYIENNASIKLFK